MRRRMWLSGLAALSLGRVWAQDPAVVQAPVQGPPGSTAVRPAPSPAQSAMNAPGMLAGAESAAAAAPVLSATPRMIGDFPGYFGYGAYTVRYCLSGTITNNGPPTGDPIRPPINLDNFAKVDETFTYAAMNLARGSFKIGENEPVRPTDRVFATYHYFHQIPNGLVSSTGILTPTATSPFGTPGTPYVLRGTLGATLTNDPNSAPASLLNTQTSASNVHRETIGFEKTFLNANASIGMRLPFFQTDQASSSSFNSAALQSFSPFNTTGMVVGGGSTLDNSRVGDLSIIFKYAFVNYDDRVISGGLVVTAPTGGGILLADGSRLYSTMLQPWVGGYRSWDRLYVHGFSSIAVPTDSRDLTLWFNDIGVGYFLYQAPEDQLITYLTPTVECHINTPLDNHRDGGIFASDSVFFTGGVHIGIGRRAVLTLGAATPVTGPRPNQVEATAQLNWFF
ncbi:MAG: hypothetical protein K1X57_00335 [Gemmataceae bacterium]|nr:hypothetical protein [Gemmataceae bacterium]